MSIYIGRRGFIAAVGIAGAAMFATPAWAANLERQLVAGGIDYSCDFVGAPDDEQIAEIVGVLDGDGELHAQTLASDGSGVTTYAGETMYETAVAQAKAAYPDGSDSAVIAGPGDAWIDALSASGLAAAKGPILFSEKDAMHKASLQALKDLKVKSVVIVGGPMAVGEGVERDLKEAGIQVEERLEGDFYYNTQLAIFNYGVKNKLWADDLMILATGGWFGDALSASPIAYASHAPIFVTGPGNKLTDEQKEVWAKAAKGGMGKRVLVVGGPAAIDESAVKFANDMSAAAKGSGKADWVYGETQYETSAEIAKWAVKNAGFAWDRCAFTTGNMPYDALAGSVLQGHDKTVMLLADSADAATISVLGRHKSEVNNVRFFGGPFAVPERVRTAVVAQVSDRVTSQETGLSYNRMLDLETDASSKLSRDQIDELMRPANFNYGEDGYYQFAVVNGGYSGVVSADDLNSYIATHGADGMLAGHGQDFIDAAREYGTNEVYLLSHAILESGWGKSQLARGTEVDGVTYYNFFGIGAYDSDPLGGGSRSAGKYGWDTTRGAITGAAKWIRDNYHENQYHQNTLYKMRWNYEQAASESAVWKQYATGSSWATGIASVMDRCYAHCGLNMDTCGLVFQVPQYS